MRPSQLFQEHDIRLREVADIVGCTVANVSMWRSIPAEYVLKIEEGLDGRVTRYQMRPDVFTEAAA